MLKEMLIHNSIDFRILIKYRKNKEIYIYKLRLHMIFYL